MTGIMICMSIKHERVEQKKATDIDKNKNRFNLVISREFNGNQCL